MARIIEPTKEGIEEAVRILDSGGLVAFPTETVYGLGADAFNPAAVMKVYEVKKRPRTSALILHISGLDMFEGCVRDPPEEAYLLIKWFWPGPLTLVLRKDERVPGAVSAGKDTVGIRWPAHPVAEAIIAGLGRPVVAPSANRSGRPSPTTAKHVVDDLGDLIDAVVDGGETPYGIESTVLDLTTDPPRILRPGAIPREKIEEVLGKEVLDAYVTKPGGVARYRIRKKLVMVDACGAPEHELPEKVMESVNLLDAKSPILLVSDETATAYSFSGAKVLVIGSRRNPLDVAKKLFKVLRVAEVLPGDVIIVEPLPSEGGLWAAINHRIREASSKVVRVC